MKRWEDADPLAGLTIVEREIVDALLEGQTFREISERRRWSPAMARKLAERASCKLPARFKGRPLVKLVAAGTEARLLRPTLSPLSPVLGRGAA